MPGIDPDRAAHILDGDKTGGGHRAGTGASGKSEFPPTWSDEKVLGEVVSVARAPGSTRTAGRDGATIVSGSRDGIDIEVVVKSGKIVTGYPTNTGRNPIK